MKIYIDFDDCICETAEFFTHLAKKLFCITVPYNEVQFFNLQKSFNIDDAQYDELMRAGHLPENLLAYKETEGAVQVINRWIDDGHEVSIITGRPFNSYEPSRRWLDEHGLGRVPLFCVDKYGRESFNEGCTYSMTLAQLYELEFDLAIEDSPAAFEHVMKVCTGKIVIFNRPWNQNEEIIDDRFVRANSWEEIYNISKKL